MALLNCVFVVICCVNIVRAQPREYSHLRGEDRRIVLRRRKPRNIPRRRALPRVAGRIDSLQWGLAREHRKKRSGSESSLRAESGSRRVALRLRTQRSPFSIGIRRTRNRLSAHVNCRIRTFNAIKRKKPHENVLPVGGARDGNVLVVVNAAGDAEPGEERDDGAAAEENGDDDDDERRRQDHLARVRQRVPDRQRERDGASAVTGQCSLQILHGEHFGAKIDKSGHQRDVG